MAREHSGHSSLSLTIPHAINTSAFVGVNASPVTFPCGGIAMDAVAVLSLGSHVYTLIRPDFAPTEILEPSLATATQTMSSRCPPLCTRLCCVVDISKSRTDKIISGKLLKKKKRKKKKKKFDCKK